MGLDLSLHASESSGIDIDSRSDSKFTAGSVAELTQDDILDTTLDFCGCGGSILFLKPRF
jgi:hypothetical protein